MILPTPCPTPATEQVPLFIYPHFASFYPHGPGVGGPETKKMHPPRQKPLILDFARNQTLSLVVSALIQSSLVLPGVLSIFYIFFCPFCPSTLDNHFWTWVTASQYSRKKCRVFRTVVDQGECKKEWQTEILTGKDDPAFRRVYLVATNHFSLLLIPGKCP